MDEWYEWVEPRELFPGAKKILSLSFKISIQIFLFAHFSKHLTKIHNVCCLCWPKVHKLFIKAWFTHPKAFISMKRRGQLTSVKPGIVIWPKKGGVHITTLLDLMPHDSVQSRVPSQPHFRTVLHRILARIPSKQASFAIPQADTLWASLEVLKAIIAFKQ